MLVSAALTVQAQRLFILPSHDARLDFVRFQYDLHDDLGGDRPPGVREADAIEAPGPRGEVVILDDCRGLYWSDGQRWWPLELGRADGLVMTPQIGPGRTVLLDAPTWRVVAVARGDEVVLAYEGPDATPRRSEPVAADVVDGVAITVEMDRVNNELTLRAGGEDLLVAWLVDLEGEPSPGPGVHVDAASTPLCDSLSARLDRGREGIRAAQR